MLRQTPQPGQKYSPLIFRVELADSIVCSGRAGRLDFLFRPSRPTRLGFRFELADLTWKKKVVSVDSFVLKVVRCGG